MTSAVLAATEAQTVSYLGRAADAAGTPSARPSAPLPLVDELSVVLSESRRLLTRRGHGGRHGTAARQTAPAAARTDGGGATYLRAALYAARRPADQTLSAGLQSGASEDRPNTHGWVLSPSQRKPFLDRVFDPIIRKGVSVWRGIEASPAPITVDGGGKAELLSVTDDVRDAPSYQSSYASYKGSASPAIAPPTTSAKPSSGATLFEKVTTAAGSSSAPRARGSTEHKRPAAPSSSSASRPAADGAAVSGTGDATIAGIDDGSVAGRDNVPGRPGRDYPTFAKLPVTGFSCRGKVHGMYADFETRCQVRLRS